MACRIRRCFDTDDRFFYPLSRIPSRIASSEALSRSVRKFKIPGCARFLGGRSGAIRGSTPPGWSANLLILCRKRQDGLGSRIAAPDRCAGSSNTGKRNCSGGCRLGLWLPVCKLSSYASAKCPANSHYHDPLTRHIWISRDRSVCPPRHASARPENRDHSCENQSLPQLLDSFMEQIS